MDAFTWSLPFVGAKITEMLLAILAVCSDQELESVSSEEEDAERRRALDDDDDSDDDTRTVADIPLSPTEIAQRRQEIKNKILAVGRMQRIFQLLRCVLPPPHARTHPVLTSHTERKPKARPSSRSRPARTPPRANSATSPA